VSQYGNYSALDKLLVGIGKTTEKGAGDFILIFRNEFMASE